MDIQEGKSLSQPINNATSGRIGALVGQIEFAQKRKALYRFAMSELETFWNTIEGHHRLTVRTIEAFPEDPLFNFKPAEPMRPFALIAGEILSLEEMIVRGVAAGEWALFNENSKYLHLSSKSEIVNAFHEVREASRRLWPKITLERWNAVEPDLWGQAPSSMQSRLEYMRDNEIHHRGQGYVYLRLLGIEPPAFFVR